MIEAMKAALDALEHHTAIKHPQQSQYRDAAITALRQAIEQAEQAQPYEIEWPEYHEHAMGCGLEDRDEHCRYGAMRYGWECAVEAVAQAIPDVIYTAPPQRKPLTDEQISNLWDGHTVPVFGKTGINPIVFARAVEAAHGIKEKNT